MNGRRLTRRTVPALVAALATLGLAPSAFAATASVSGSTLMITGGAENDVAAVQLLSAKTIRVSGEADDNPFSGDPSGVSALLFGGCVAEDEYTVLCTAAQDFTNVAATLGDGRDYFSPAGSFPLVVTANGGGGDDFLRGGSANDALTGAAGDDQLFGQAGSDIFYPGAGGDDVWGENGVDANTNTIDDTATGPRDRVDYSSAAAGVTITLDDRFNDSEAGEAGSDNIHSDVEDVVGSAFADTITGSAKVNQIVGGAGADTISGGDGNDRLAGAAGTFASTQVMTGSTTAAGDGVSTIDGGEGDDTVWSSVGNDAITTGNGADVVAAGDGNNNVSTGDGSDQITTGTGDDLIGAGSGDDPAVNAGNGKNEVRLGDGDDTAVTGTGQDLVLGGTGVDSITTGAGADNALGEGGADVIATGDGDDSITGGLQADEMRAGAGLDTISYADKNEPVHAKIGGDLSGTNCAGTPTPAGCEGDRVFDAENLTGGSAGDTLVGSGAVNTLRGGDGNDLLEALAGDDVVFGEGGDDTLVGGAGGDEIHGGDGTNDAVSYRDAASGVNVTLDGVDNDGESGEGDNLFDDIESIEGSAFGDDLTGSDSNNTLRGLAGGDVLDGRGGNDTLTGAEGSDSLDGGTGADGIDGGADQDTVSYERTAAVSVSLDDVANDGETGEGDNVSSVTENVVTGTGDDTIVGNGLANLIDGGEGDDTLDGGLGSDDIRGGKGSDRVVYSGRSATDVISVSLEGAPNDGSILAGAVENDNVRPDVENITTGDSLDFVEGSPGANSIITGGGDDRIRSGAENDTIDSGAGADYVDAGAGDDSIDGGVGADRIIGGAGENDIADYSSRTAAVTVTNADGLANDGEEGEGDNVDSSTERVDGPVAPAPAPEPEPEPQPAAASSGETTTGSSTGTQTVNPTTEQKQGSALFASAKQLSGRRVLIRGKILVKARNGLAQSAAACRGGGRVVVTVRKGTRVVGKKLVLLSRTCSFRAPVTLARGATGKLRVEVRFLGNRALKASRRTTNLQVNG